MTRRGMRINIIATLVVAAALVLVGLATGQILLGIAGFVLFVVAAVATVLLARSR